MRNLRRHSSGILLSVIMQSILTPIPVAADLLPIQVPGPKETRHQPKTTRTKILTKLSSLWVIHRKTSWPWAIMVIGSRSKQHSLIEASLTSWIAESTQLLDCRIDRDLCRWLMELTLLSLLAVKMLSTIPLTLQLLQQSPPPQLPPTLTRQPITQRCTTCTQNRLSKKQSNACKRTRVPSGMTIKSRSWWSMQRLVITMKSSKSTTKDVLWRLSNKKKLCSMRYLSKRKTTSWRPKYWRNKKTSRSNLMR